MSATDPQHVAWTAWMNHVAYLKWTLEQDGVVFDPARGDKPADERMRDYVPWQTTLYEVVSQSVFHKLPSVGQQDLIQEIRNLQNRMGKTIAGARDLPRLKVAAGRPALYGEYARLLVVLRVAEILSTACSPQTGVPPASALEFRTAVLDCTSEAKWVNNHVWPITRQKECIKELGRALVLVEQPGSDFDNVLLRTAVFTLAKVAD
ncbi:hypothetical protein JCM11641_005175 [Rhodosporidiobolus odoratus]